MLGLLFWQAFAIGRNTGSLCWIDGILTVLVAERFFELPGKVFLFWWRSEYVVSGLFYRGGRWKAGILQGGRRRAGRSSKVDGKVAAASGDQSSQRGHSELEFEERKEKGKRSLFFFAVVFKGLDLLNACIYGLASLTKMMSAGRFFGRVCKNAACRFP